MWIRTERIASFPSKKWTDGKTETYGSDQKHTAQLSGQWHNQKATACQLKVSKNTVREYVGGQKCNRPVWL